MKEITYLIYIIFWETVCFAPVFCAVFWLNKSGWWFLLAIYLSQAAYSPYKWGIEGAKPTYSEKKTLCKEDDVSA
jgi:hypothetical protein